MNVLLTQYSEISELKEKADKGGGAEEEREGVEGKVSYSVSGDWQITLKKNHMISWKLDFK